MGTYPFYRGIIDLSNENMFRDKLVNVFKRFGWKCDTEVKSDNGKYRADIIAQHDIWGKIGLELKYGHKARPRKWANALRQIQTYRNESFNGSNINKWAVGVLPSYDYDTDLSKESGKRRNNGYKEFFNTLGFGYLRLEYRIEIIFNNSNPMVKYPVANIKYPSGRLEAPELRRYENCNTTKAINYEPSAGFS